MSRWLIGFVFALAAISAAAQPSPKTPESVEVRRWEMHEFRLLARSQADNPYRDAMLTGQFTSPTGRVITVLGFYDGDNIWRLRFTPDEEGIWSYRLRGERVDVAETGRLRCAPPLEHGFIQIHPDNPYAFAYADGTPFFPLGDTCYGLYDDSPITPSLRLEYLKARRSQRFNFLRMSVGHSAPRAESDPASYWAWGGTPEQPDLDRLNPEFFRGLDGCSRSRP